MAEHSLRMSWDHLHADMSINSATFRLACDMLPLDIPTQVVKERLLSNRGLHENVSDKTRLCFLTVT